MQNHNPVLTISLLISNRPDTIPRCLDSLRPIMEAIPSELILIDTSKNEEIHKLLLTYTDRVYDFQWCNNFAKARNEGLKRAKGEWFMFLDDDEWFVEIEDLIDFFQSGEYKNYGYANHEIRNFQDEEFKHYRDAWVTRIFKIEEETAFVGKVHETFSPTRGKLKYINALSYHSGYVYKDKDAARKHFERNTKILLEVMKEEPDNLRWQAQMIQEYRAEREWEAMCQLCGQKVQNVKQVKTTEDANHFGTLYAGWIESLFHLKRYEESIAVAKRAMADARSIELVTSWAYLYMVQNYIALNNHKAAKKYILRYLKDYKTYKHNETLMKQRSTSLVLQNVFDDNYVQTLYGMLVFCDLKLGNTEELTKYYDELKWGKKDGYTYLPLVKELVATIATTEYKEEYGLYIKDAFQKESLSNLLCGEVQEWEAKDEKAFLNIAKAFAKAEQDFWFVWYCRIFVTEEQGDKKGLEEAMVGFLRSVNNVFYLPDKVVALAKKNEINLPVLWNELPQDKWKSQMEYIINHLEKEYAQKTRAILCEEYNTDDWQLKYVDRLIAEVEIKKGPQDSITDYYNLLCSYAESFKEESPVAKQIQAFLDLEEQETIQALKKLKELVDMNPDFATGIGAFVQAYSDLETQRASSQNQEMLQLRNQVLQQVFVMLDNGMKKEALQIVQQLEGMFPDDMELLELENNINNK